MRLDETKKIVCAALLHDSEMRYERAHRTSNSSEEEEYRKKSGDELESGERTFAFDGPFTVSAAHRWLSNVAVPVSATPSIV